MTTKMKHPVTGEKEPTQASGKLRQTGAEITERAKETQQAMSENAQQAIGEAREVVAQAGQRAREVTEQQPMLVALGALSIGVMLGMAIKARS